MSHHIINSTIQSTLDRYSGLEWTNDEDICRIAGLVAKALRDLLPQISQESPYLVYLLETKISLLTKLAQQGLVGLDLSELNNLSEIACFYNFFQSAIDGYRFQVLFNVADAPAHERSAHFTLEMFRRSQMSSQIQDDGFHEFYRTENNSNGSNGIVVRVIANHSTSHASSTKRAPISTDSPFYVSRAHNRLVPDYQPTSAMGDEAVEAISSRNTLTCT